MTLISLSNVSLTAHLVGEGEEICLVTGTVPITTQSFHGGRFMGKRKEDFFCG
jgi:hypothetical protein